MLRKMFVKDDGRLIVSCFDSRFFEDNSDVRRDLGVFGESIELSCVKNESELKLSISNKRTMFQSVRSQTTAIEHIECSRTHGAKPRV